MPAPEVVHVKVCRGCDRTLPSTAFYWHKYQDRPWKRRAQCIECMCLFQTKRNVARAAALRAGNRQRRLAQKTEVR